MTLEEIRQLARGRVASDTAGMLIEALAVRQEAAEELLNSIVEYLYADARCGLPEDARVNLGFHKLPLHIERKP